MHARGRHSWRGRFRLRDLQDFVSLLRPANKATKAANIITHVTCTDKLIYPVPSSGRSKGPPNIHMRAHLFEKILNQELHRMPVSQGISSLDNAFFTHLWQNQARGHTWSKTTVCTMVEAILFTFLPSS